MSTTTREVEARQELRHELLLWLYQQCIEAQGGQAPSHVERHLADFLGAALQEIRFALWMLEDQNAIRRDGPKVVLTVIGARLAEASLIDNTGDHP